MKKRFILMEEELEKAYQEICQFFNYEKEIFPININIKPEDTPHCEANNTIILPRMDINILRHELCHLVYGYSKFNNLPLWNEGIAEYFRSEGKCENKINFEIVDLKGENNMQYNYGVGLLLIYSIMKHFKDSKKIISFLKHEEPDLHKRFEIIFGMDVNTLIKLEGGKQ